MYEITIRMNGFNNLVFTTNTVADAITLAVQAITKGANVDVISLLTGEVIFAHTKNGNTIISKALNYTLQLKCTKTKGGNALFFVYYAY